MSAILRYRPGPPVAEVRALASGLVLARGHDGTLQVVDVAAGRVLWTERAGAFAVSPDGKRVAAVLVDQGHSLVAVLDAATGRRIAGARPADAVEHLAWIPYGERIAWTSFAPPVDYGEVVLWDFGSGHRVECRETPRCGPLAFVDADTLAVAEHGDLLVVRGGEIARHFDALWAEQIACFGSFEAVLTDEHGHVAAFDLATGERRWEWEKPPRGAFEVAVERVWPRRVARVVPGALEWREAGHAARSVAEPPGEGRWKHARWIPRWERLAACTAHSVRLVDARTGAVVRLWNTTGSEVVALDVGPDGAVAWATQEGEIFLTAPAPHVRKVVEAEKATLSFVDGELVVPVYTGPDFFYEMSQFAEGEAVAATLLRDADRLVVVVEQKTHLRGGSNTTEKVVHHVFASDDAGRSWHALDLDASEIAALTRRSAYIMLIP
jgi:hypothetical protein